MGKGVVSWPTADDEPAMIAGGVAAGIGPPGKEPVAPDVSLPVSEDMNDKSLPELLKDLSQELTALLHEEIELAKAEVTAKGKPLGAGGRFARRRRCPGPTRVGLLSRLAPSRRCR